MQAIIRRWARQGYATLIVGDADHPEVRGLMGHTQGRGYVVATSEEVAALPELQDLIVVAQTTQSGSQFNARVAEIQARFPQARIFNTICDATASRQGEVQELAQQVEALVVVGGRNSGNTQRLVEISRDSGDPHLPRGDRAGTGPGGDEPLSHRGGDRGGLHPPLAHRQCGEHPETRLGLPPGVLDQLPLPGLAVLPQIQPLCGHWARAP